MMGAALNLQAPCTHHSPGIGEVDVRVCRRLRGAMLWLRVPKRK